MVVHGNAYANDLYDLTLEYFEGEPRTQELSKEFSDKCVEELFELQKLLRAFDESIYKKDEVAIPAQRELLTPTEIPKSGVE